MDTSALVDPATYEAGPPFDDAAAGSATPSPVVWVGGAGAARAGGGPGLLAGAAARRGGAGAARPRDVLLLAGRDPDPRRREDLEWVRRMMLNMDPPDHSRLRRLLTRSFTPARRRGADGRDRGDGGATRRPDDRRCRRGPLRLRQGRRRRPAADHAGRRARRAGRGPLADVRLVQPGDRLAGPRLRVVGARSTGPAGRRWPGRRSALRPLPAPTAGCPTRAPAPACPTSTPTPGCSAEREAAASRRRRHVDPAGPGRRRRAARVSDARVREPVLAVRRRRERDAAQRAARRADRAAASTRSSWRRCAPTRRCCRPRSRRCCAGGRRSWCSAGPRPSTPSSAGTAIRAGRQGRRVVHLGQPRRARVRRPRPLRLRRAPNPHLSFGHGPHFCLGAHLARAQMRALFGELLAAHGAIELDGEPVLPALELPARRQAAADPLDRLTGLRARS